jgi:hypothetical protein
MTTDVLPSAERPAVSAKGTVRPSERPMMASERRRALLVREGPLEVDEERSGLDGVSFSTSLVCELEELWRGRDVGVWGMAEKRGLDGRLKRWFMRKAIVKRRKLIFGLKRG